MKNSVYKTVYGCEKMSSFGRLRDRTVNGKIFSTPCGIIHTSEYNPGVRISRFHCSLISLFALFLIISNNTIYIL